MKLYSNPTALQCSNSEAWQNSNPEALQCGITGSADGEEREVTLYKKKKKHLKHFRRLTK